MGGRIKQGAKVMEVTCCIASVFYLICGYGLSKDLNFIYGCEKFDWINILAVLLWPVFIFIRSLAHIYEELK
jgi:hypothetical protein